jgi:DNA primase
VSQLNKKTSLGENVQFPPQFIEELNGRLQPSLVVGARVKLKHKGGGEYSGLCPFHNEKTPSFSVSDNKGFYHCFGCGAHGNNIKFVMETEGLGFVEAITKLAEMAGMNIPKPDKFQQQKYEKQLTLYDVCEEACKWMEKQLRLTGGEKGLAYIKQRGLDEETIKTFRIGFAPDGRTSLKAAMLKKDFTEQQLIDVGLVIQPDDDKRGSYDRFRNRVMFPIMDFKGRVIAFGGRIIGDGKPKYLNSPETELFHKGNVLYAYHQARQSAYDSGAIIAVEGYMDVIALYAAGIKNAVAPLGTAITEQQLKLMWKVTKEPTLCMDGDSAGLRSMSRAAHNCLPFLEPGYSLRFATLPAGLDPDDLIKDKGVKALHDVLNNALPLSETLWNIKRSEVTPSTPEQQAFLEEQLMELKDTITNETVAGYYFKFFKNQLWEFQKESRANKNYNNDNKQGGNKNKFGAVRKVTAANQAQLSTLQRYEHTLTFAPFYHPALLNSTEAEENYSAFELRDEALANIRNELLDTITSNDISDHQDLLKELDGDDILHAIRAQAKRCSMDPSLEAASPLNLAKTAWDYVISCYQSELTDQEYINLTRTGQSMSQITLERVEELKKQKDALKKLVKLKYLSYEAALDD